MKSIIPAALVLVLEVGFILSIAVLPDAAPTASQAELAAGAASAGAQAAQVVTQAPATKRPSRS